MKEAVFALIYASNCCQVSRPLVLGDASSIKPADASSAISHSLTTDFYTSNNMMMMMMMVVVVVMMIMMMIVMVSMIVM